MVQSSAINLTGTEKQGRPNQFFYVSFCQELIDNYQHLLPVIQLSGPTLFSPVLQHIITHIPKEVSQEMQHFTLALIITDGICNDPTEFKEKLLEYSESPSSLVIACVGAFQHDTWHYFNVSTDIVST